MSVSPRGGEDALPQVIGLEPVWVRWVAGAIVPALVERQEPRGLALQMSAEAHLGVVHGKVHHTAPELEQQFPRVAVALVLLHRVFHGLFREAVL